MISLHQLLKHYGYDPSEVKLVRHGNAEIDILKTYQKDIQKFEAYQSFQNPGKFAGASHIAVFAPTLGTTALFLGLWDIKARKNSGKFTEEIHSILNLHEFPELWHTESEWYQLERNNEINELSERLVIEWGKAVVAWVQNKDKEILEIKGQNSIGEFTSYDEILLSYYDLKKLISQGSLNASWVSALSAVNGIYLIKDHHIGKLYVGSAYGENGIFGRWSTYAQTGHGGNKELKSLDPINFEFSILEIAPPTSSAADVIARENRWKIKLGTREFGLNNN